MALDGTYSGLIASVADWLHRTDLTGVLPDLVKLVEETANYGDEELDIPPLRTSDQEIQWTSASSLPATCTAGSNYITLPSDYVEMRQLYVIDSAGIKQELKRSGVSPLFVSDRANVQRLPQWFFESAGQIYLIPQPDIAYNLHGIYYRTIPGLQAASTNWLMTSHPRVYLFGTCMYAGPWLGADNRVALWAKGFRGAINALNTSDKRKRRKNVLMRSEAADLTQGGMYDINTGMYVI